ncbi:MAG: hypothetical protein AB1483_01610 [Candidatus Zixiibacteriota bacterium]
MKKLSMITGSAILLTLAGMLFMTGCSSDKAVSPAVNDPSVGASLAPVDYDVWQFAQTEMVTTSPDLDMLSRRAMGIDDMGTVHAIYQRGIGAEQGLYYVCKPQGGQWSQPEIVGAPGTYPGTGWLEVCEETGEAYVAFYNVSDLQLGIRRGGAWEMHTLDTPDEYGVGKPALAVDAAGIVHVAMMIDWDTESGYVMWQIAYGYFDGSSDFHFQVLENSIVPHYGLFSSPDIVAREDGSVVIAYHHDAAGQLLIRVEENNALGGKEWTAEHVDVPGVIVYPESLERDAEGNLHLGFHTNIELGAEYHTYYACRRGDGHFGGKQEVDGDYAGARPRIAFTPDNEPHLVFEELLGPRSTGRLIHAYRSQGKWVQEVVVDNLAATPSFAIDKSGNGSILYESRVVLLEDNNIGYFGFVAPVQ